MLNDSISKENLDEYYDFLYDVIDSKENGMDIIILQKIQKIFGYIPEDIIYETSRITGIPTAKLYGTATFYHQFSFEPKGKHVIQVCLGTACYIKGSGQILEELQRMLGIKAGEVTKDGLFSIDTTRCVGACGLAPVMSVDGKIYGRLTDDKLKGIIESYKETDYE